MTTEAEIGVMCPQGKEWWQPQTLEEARNRFSLRASGGSVALLTLISALRDCFLCDNNFYKPPSLW